MQWGDEYRTFHVAAWRELYRVMRRGGWFVLNVKDHVRKFEVMAVSAWHVEALRTVGFVAVRRVQVNAPGLRQGQNHSARVDHENVYLFNKPELPEDGVAGQRDFFTEPSW
jgi:hypothetical protein